MRFCASASAEFAKICKPWPATFVFDFLSGIFSIGPGNRIFRQRKKRMPKPIKARGRPPSGARPADFCFLFERGANAPPLRPPRRRKSSAFPFPGGRYARPRPPVAGGRTGLPGGAGRRGSSGGGNRPVFEIRLALSAPTLRKRLCEACVLQARFPSRFQQGARDSSLLTAESSAQAQNTAKSAANSSKTP